MKFLVAALVACLYVACTAEARLVDDPGHHAEHRPRLGHFSNEPFTDLYKIYAAAFVKPLYADRDADDYRNYLPSGDECMTFFRKFRIDEYELRDLDDFIVFDACLGYLYQEKQENYHERDSEASEFVKSNLQAFKDDQKLKEFYDKTQIDSYTQEAKECVGDLLFDAVKAKHQFPDLLCNNDWLQIFINFAECQKALPETARAQDSYLSVIYTLVKRRGLECFQNEISALNAAVREEFIGNHLNRLSNTFTLNKLKKQGARRIYPKEMMKLLRAVQGTDKEINLREVADIIRGIVTKHPNFEQRLLNNMANFADATIKAKTGSSAMKADPSGMVRYDALVNDLCNFFRSSDNSKHYDYSTPFIRMVKMLEYPEIFDISQEYFIEHVLQESEESGPLYLCVSSCNLLTFTEGAFQRVSQNSAPKYKVLFKPDTSSMVQWPDLGFY